MDREELRLRFPAMRPLAKAPTLMSINGCGLGMYGKREFDRETGTYIKTRSLCVLFVPVLAVDAFRVADASAGWYFLGKESLSPFAKAWNLLLVVGIAASVAWAQYDDYRSSPAYRDHEAFVAAQASAGAGDLPAAAKGYADLMAGGPSTEEAHAALAALIAGSLDGLPPKQGLAVLGTVADVRAAQREPDLGDATLAAHARTLTTHARTADPRTAIGLIDLTRHLIAPKAARVAKGAKSAKSAQNQGAVENPAAAPEDLALAADRVTLLTAYAALAPEDPWPAIELAILADERGDEQRCQELLEPHAKRLGATEGARILGSRYAALGRIDDSFPLLDAYTGAGLKKLHAAEAAWENAYKQSSDRALAALRGDEAGADWYARYEHLDKAHQQEAVDAWISARVAADTGLEHFRSALAAAAVIVPTAMDLGIVTLQRAQGQADPAAKKKDLEAAERTFLAIRGVAGDSDRYRESLAQVYYWLGKPGDGRALLDQMLVDHKRDGEGLLRAAGILRLVGAESESRTLSEEAYANAGNTDQKYAAATLRSVTFTDIDDEIVWLSRCDQAQPRVVAGLAELRGRKAAEAGHDAEAAVLLRQAVDAWAKLPEDASTLNNGALAVLALFETTGERTLLERGTTMLGKAFALEPGDSILLKNQADIVLQGMLMDVIGTRLDQVRLHRFGEFGMLRFLYNDEAGRVALMATLAKHPDLPRVLGLYEKLVVIRAKQRSCWSPLIHLRLLARDIPAARTLLQRLAQVELDHGDAAAKAKADASGANDVAQREDNTRALIRPEQVIKELGRAGGATFAFAVDVRTDLLVDLAACGGPALTDDVVAHCDQAYAAAPSVGSRHALSHALLGRCAAALAARDPAAAALIARLQRIVSPSALLPVLLDLDHGRAAGVLADADFTRACALRSEDAAAFPSAPSGWTWALLRWTSADQGAALAARIRGDDYWPVSEGIDLLMSPWSTNTTLDAWWLQRARGDQDAAHALLVAAQARGVALPLTP